MILCCTTDFEVFFVHCTNLSQVPLKWGSLGGWKFHSVSFGTQKFCTLFLFSCLRHFCSSLLSPKRLAPLSLHILYGHHVAQWALSINTIMKWSVKDHLPVQDGKLLQMETYKQKAVHLTPTTSLLNQKSTADCLWTPFQVQAYTQVSFPFAAPGVLLSDDRSNCT